MAASNYFQLLMFAFCLNTSIHHIFNEKLTKRNSVQYEGKISLCTLIQVFKQLSSNEVSGVRLNSQRTVVTARSQFIRVVSSAWQEVVKNMMRIG